MPEAGFHFAQPLWLFGLCIILIVAWWQYQRAHLTHQGPIHLYADPHLLPHLTGKRELVPQERLHRLFRFTLMWTLGILAMAGPRWDYVDVRLFHPGNNLLILLDISRSMQVTDVTPSRLERAKQEIQDIIMLNHAARIGLIAFASVPHVIAPITEDMGTLINALPAIETDLVELQGSRLINALDRAEILLNGLSKDSAKTILVISDGDFDEPDLDDRVRQLTKQNIKLATFGIGTIDGGIVPNRLGGELLNSRQQPISSALNASELTRLAEMGQGFYREASFQQSDTTAILEMAARSQQPQNEMNEITRIWNERFYILLIPFLALFWPYLLASGTKNLL